MKNAHHISHDCNISKDEAITTKKKRPITMEIGRLMEVRQIELAYDEQNLEAMLNRFGGRESLLYAFPDCAYKSQDS